MILIYNKIIINKELKMFNIYYFINSVRLILLTKKIRKTKEKISNLTKKDCLSSRKTVRLSNNYQELIRKLIILQRKIILLQPGQD